MSTQIEVNTEDARAWAAAKSLTAIAAYEKELEAQKEAPERRKKERAERIAAIKKQIADEEDKGFFGKSRRKLESLEWALFAAESDDDWNQRMFDYASISHLSAPMGRAKRLNDALAAHVARTVLLGLDDYEFLTKP